MKAVARLCIAGIAAVSLAAASPSGAWAAAAKVVLDAGHGGYDPGAVGVNGLYEKDVNLSVVLKLRAELIRRGYDVLLTRDTDVFLSLAERVEITDRIKPDLFVSVHANSYSNSSTRGTMVLYYDKAYPQEDYPASDAMTALTEKSRALAQDVQSKTVQAAGTTDKGLVPSAVYVVRMGSVPSVLVETAFLSNPQDAGLLADDGFRVKLATGIADGIEAYLPAKKPDPKPGPFQDVSGDYWAQAAITKLKALGIVEGENGLFHPERPLTRAEFITMLTREFQLPAPTGPAPKVPRDLPPTHWAYAVMKQALDAGVLNGYEDGSIRPSASLTRGEAAVLIDRVIYPGSSTAAGTQRFKDVPGSLWSAAAINRLKAKGIIDGTTADTFEPERTITRAEMCALLDRLIH